LDDFAKWVNDDSKLSPINTVRQLPRILSNPDARKKFIAQNAREAMKLIEQPSSTAVITEATIDQLANALAHKIRNMNYSDVKILKENHDSAHAQALSDCYGELRDLCQDAGLIQQGE
jgi:hypothetical protein